MSIPATVLDDIRARVGLADVIGRKVRLTRAGRQFKGCCPFHNEKTPSFLVYPDDGHYHCFGCGAHGSVFDFVMHSEGLGFREAVERLAAEANIVLPAESPEEQARAARADTLKDVMAWAAGWFAEQLGGVQGGEARAYLDRRGLQPATVRGFGLGFAPEGRTRLKAALAGAGIDEALAVEAGLLIAPEDGSAPFDRFRDRIIFPIRNARGLVIAFGGRAMDPKAQAKYLNSPETPLFTKGRTLYNFDRAGPAARKAGQIIVVEGYMDVIALAQAGVETAVAPLGTALTEDQMRLLWRAAPEPLLCFDGDAAGQKAAERAAHRALAVLEPGRSLRFALLPQGQDPDDLVRAGGRAAFDNAIANPVPLVDVLWQTLLAGRDLSTPERRASLRQDVQTLARDIGNSNVRDLYQSEFALRLDRVLNPGGGRTAGATRGDSRAGASLGLRSAANTGGGVLAHYRAAILLAAVNHPALLDNHMELFANVEFDNEPAVRLHQHLLDVAAHAPGLDRSALSHILETEGFEKIIRELKGQGRLQIRFAADSASFDEAERGFVLVCEAIVRLSALDSELHQATAAFGEAMDEAGFVRQQALRAERQRLIDDLKQKAQ